MKKIYTEIKICVPAFKPEQEKLLEFKGKLSPEDFELTWDLLEVIWQLEHDEQTLAIMKKTLNKLKEVMAKYNEEMDNI